jgi:cation diffusion facilitator CzcD-associated flavoprotein CzcO
MSDRVSPASSPELRALEQRVSADLERLNYPERAWLPRRFTAAGQSIHDVIVVGGGQSGLTAAFGLMRERIGNLLVIDQCAPDRAGPWLSFARMRTLRTPKYLTGPDLGIPSLTPRAWYEARNGAASWQSVGLIPKEMWAEYLAWYRRTLGIPVRSETRVGALSWNAAERCWDIPCQPAAAAPAGVASASSEEVLHARRVILATGIEGSGQWHVPAMIREGLPPHLYAHTRWEIDFDGLRGKRVAVLGCGASAFDNAATALEHGAREVRLFFRRKEVVQVNAYRWAEFVGFLRHLGDLPDADKWRFILQIMRMGQLPPSDTYQRAMQHAGFHLHPASGWHSVAAHGDTVVIEAESGTFEADFVIVGTGFVTDLGLRPELAHVERHIARWGDRYVPPVAERNEDLLRHPYLGGGFEFVERQPGDAPYLRYLHNYTFGGLLSLGFGGGSISGMKYSIPRLVGGVTGSLFVEDREAHFQSLYRYGEQDGERDRGKDL